MTQAQHALATIKAYVASLQREDVPPTVTISGKP